MHIISSSHSESTSAKYVITVFIILVVSLILGAPPLNEGKDSLVYDSLMNTCPLLTGIQFQNYSNFTRECGSLENLINFKVEKNVNVADAEKVLCLLYFNSFNSSCSNDTELKSDILLEDVQIKKDVSLVCKKLPQILSQVTWPQNLSIIFQVEDNCRYLCIDTSDIHRDICILSYGIIQYGLKKHNISNSNTTNSAVPHIEGNKLGNSSKNVLITSGVKESHNDADQDKKVNVPQQNEERRINDTHPAEERFNSRKEDINTDNNGGDNSDKPKNSLEDILPHNEEKSKINGNPTAKNSNTGDTEIQKADLNIDNDNSVNPVQESQQNILQDKQGSVDDEFSEDGLEDPRNVNAEDNNENSQPYIAEDNTVSKDNGNNEQSVKYSKSVLTDNIDSYPLEMDGDSYFFSYFIVICIIFILGYVVYHNKQKVLALIVEGRQGKRQYRSKRPNSASYHKLDSNLEEAILSSCNKNTSNVIY